MSTISYMPFNEIEDYVDEIEEKLIQAETENEEYKTIITNIDEIEEKLIQAETENEEYKTIITNIAEKLGINPHSIDFKFYPEVAIWSKIEELRK